LNAQDVSFHLKEIKFEVTHDCLLNCAHCSSKSRPDSGLSMDLVTYERILDEAYDMGVKLAVFSGGEPLLWDYIDKAISRSLEYGIETILYTTGNVTNAEKRLRELYSIGLRRAIFSIFGSSAAEHEAVTKYKGSYQQTIRVLIYCFNIGIKTEVHFVPLSCNYKNLMTIARLSAKLNVERISILRLVPQGRASDICEGQLNRCQNIELRNMIKLLREKGHDIRVGSPYNFLMLRKNPKCRAGSDRMTISPDYCIFPCDAFKHISPDDIGERSELSNLKNHSLKECWIKSPYFNAVREYLVADFAEECKSCNKLKECNSGCMAQKFYAYGELLKCPDPMCLVATGERGRRRFIN